MEKNKNRFYENNHKKATMRDVATAAGVSISTVSHVINGTQFVTRKTAQKVEAAIEDLAFTRNLVARNLRSGKSGLIGFVVSNLENYFYVRIAKGVERVLNKEGYHLVLVDSQEDRETEIIQIEALYNSGVEGLIVVPTGQNYSGSLSFIPPTYPLLFVDRQAPHFHADTILLANQKAAYRATHHFIRTGHTNIAFFAYHFGDESIDFTMQERIDGYKEALIEAGIEVNPNFIQVTAGAPSSTHELRYADSYRATEALLTSNITAILCGNSLAAVGVFAYLKDQGVRIPQEVALITFDNDPWLTMASPTISAIAQPEEMFGTIGARRLLERIRGHNLPYESIRLNAEFILREST